MGLVLALLDLVTLALVVLFVFSQVVLPLEGGTKLFPLFLSSGKSKSEKRLEAAQKRLEEAKSAKAAAETEVAAAKLESEAAQLRIESLSTTLDEENNTKEKGKNNG